MAFDGRHRETQRGGGFGGASASVEEVDSGAASAFQDLEEDLVKFRRCIESMGTTLDDNDNRKEMKRLRSVIKSKVSEAQSQLKAGKKAKDPQNRILFDRQSKQLDTQIASFQSLLGKEKAAMKQNPAPSNQSGAAWEGNGGYSDETSMMSHNVQASQVQRMAGLEEREMDAQELVELERDILDLRDIHTQVAELVTEQGEDIDKIDKNVVHAAVRTEAATKQLKTAVILQKKNRRVKVILVVSVVTVILIVVIVLVILLAIFIPKKN